MSIFPASIFVPVVLGFFGLGTGYLIYGPQELLGYPRRDPKVDRANGVWGLWMAGFCQFLVGVFLFVGLTWFPVFTNNKALYMAALAFSAYGIHWFAMGWNRVHCPRCAGQLSVEITLETDTAKRPGLGSLRATPTRGTRRAAPAATAKKAVAVVGHSG